MTVLFFAVLGALGIIGVFVYDMERKRQQMLGVLVRIEGLARDGKSARRAQNLRRLGMSIFFNGQLQIGLEREVTALEKAMEVPQPEEVRLSMSTKKRLQMWHDRLGMLEMTVAARKEEEHVAEEPVVAEAVEESEEGERAAG